MFYSPLPWGHICICVADELKHQLDEGARVLLISNEREKGSELIT